MGEPVRIESRRFGSIALDEKDLIVFAGGLPGFPHARRFALVAHDRGTDFAWLVSADQPELAFVVTDPWRFFAAYQPEVPGHVLRALGVGCAEELEWFVIATAGPARTTLNLAAPLLVNATTRRALQLILDCDTYSTREAIVAPASEPQSGAARP
jgi:flagellar assembly factor FliW